MTPTRPKQTDQDGEDNKFIFYRLDQVEAAVLRVEGKVERQDNIKRADLKEFQETIVTRFLDMRADLQKQIDSKAEKGELTDLKKQFYSVLAVLSSIMTALILAYLTTRK